MNILYLDLIIKSNLINKCRLISIVIIWKEENEKLRVLFWDMVGGRKERIKEELFYRGRIEGI